MEGTLHSLVVPRSAQSDRPRYKEWRATSLTALRMVPTFSGETFEILKFENLCIASLQAPAQQGIGPAQAPRTYRPRKLSRFRKKPSTEEKLNRNLMDELRRSPASRRKFDFQCSSFGSLCTFAMDHFKLRAYSACRSSYTCTATGMFIGWRCTSLGQGRDSPIARCGGYPTQWSFVQGYGVLVKKSQSIPSMWQFQKFCAFYTLDSYFLVAYTRSEYQQPQRDTTLPQRSASELSWMWFGNGVPRQQHGWSDRCSASEDCERRTCSGHLQTKRELASTSQLRSWTSILILKKKVSYVGRMSTGCLTTGLLLELTARVTPCGQLMRASPPFRGKSWEVGRSSLEGTPTRPGTSGQISPVGTNRTVLTRSWNQCDHLRVGTYWFLWKRMSTDARSSVDGYLYKLAHCYFEAPKHYKVRDDLCPDAAAVEKAKLIYKWLGPERSTVELPINNQLPTAYHTIKGKCLDKSGSGLSCKKDHAHEREIVANAKDPAKRTMALAARALRLAKKLSNEPGWTLWNQAELPFVLRQRLSKLKTFPEYVHKCPCGRTKPCQTTCAKVDASQFFKDASAPRGVQRTDLFLKRLQKRTGKTTVAVRRGPGALGHLCTGGPQKGRAFEMCSFSQIRKAIALAAEDKLFLLGDTVLERTRGWPMGGSFSEPATLVDLGESVYRLYTDGGNTARRVGWALDKARPDQLVQGLQHVDGAAIFSEVFCSECLLRGPQKLWPRDVGVSLEETGT